MAMTLKELQKIVAALKGSTTSLVGVAEGSEEFKELCELYNRRAALVDQEKGFGSDLNFYDSAKVEKYKKRELVRSEIDVLTDIIESSVFDETFEKAVSEDFRNVQGNSIEWRKSYYQERLKELESDNQEYLIQSKDGTEDLHSRFNRREINEKISPSAAMQAQVALTISEIKVKLNPSLYFEADPLPGRGDRGGRTVRFPSHEDLELTDAEKDQYNLQKAELRKSLEGLGDKCVRFATDSKQLGYNLDMGAKGIIPVVFSIPEENTYNHFTKVTVKYAEQDNQEVDLEGLKAEIGRVQEYSQLIKSQESGVEQEEEETPEIQFAGKVDPVMEAGYKKYVKDESHKDTERRELGDDVKNKITESIKNSDKLLVNEKGVELTAKEAAKQKLQDFGTVKSGSLDKIAGMSAQSVATKAVKASFNEKSGRRVMQAGVEGKDEHGKIIEGQADFDGDKNYHRYGRIHFKGIDFNKADETEDGKEGKKSFMNNFANCEFDGACDFKDFALNKNKLLNCIFGNECSDEQARIQAAELIKLDSHNIAKCRFTEGFVNSLGNQEQEAFKDKFGIGELGDDGFYKTKEVEIKVNPVKAAKGVPQVAIKPTSAIRVIGFSKEVDVAQAA